jgi:hypothetical protein
MTNLTAIHKCRKPSRFVGIFHQKNMGRLEASSLQSEEENRPKRFEPPSVFESHKNNHPFYELIDNIYG